MCVTAAGSFSGTSECLPRNSGGVRNSEFAHGVRMTLSSCKQNTNLFGRAGLTTPTRLGFLFRLTFYVTFRRNGIHDQNYTQRGCRYGSDSQHGAEYTVLPTLLLNDN